MTASCIFLLTACDNDRDILLEEALEKAGNNRTELEQVLAHYAGDSIKLEAAKFLIRNLPGHYSYADTSELIPYYDAVDSLLVVMGDPITSFFLDFFFFIMPPPGQNPD